MMDSSRSNDGFVKEPEAKIQVISMYFAIKSNSEIFIHHKINCSNICAVNFQNDDYYK